MENNKTNWKRTFAIIWAGQLFSTLTSSIVGYAVVFWLSIETGSAEVLAFSMIATLLPQLALGLVMGVFIDRWDRKRTMIFADGFIAACTAVLCLMLLFGEAEIWHIYVLLAARSLGSAFHSPAMQASVPLLAPESELMRIAGVNQMIYSISSIAGPALAALLISLFNITCVLVLDIAGAIIACTSLLFVTIPNPEKEEGKERHIFREMKEGLYAIFSKRGLAWLFCCDVLVMFFIIPISVLFPLMTLNHFMGNTYQMSVVEISWGIGMLAGGAVISLKRMKKANKIILIALTCITIGLTFFLSGLLPATGLIAFVLLTAISGLAAAIWNSAFTVILQTKIDTALQGRVFSTYDSLMLIPSIPGLLATGFIAESIGLTNAFVYSGIIICIVGIALFFIPSVMELGKIHLSPAPLHKERGESTLP
ncbi:MFS transporter [Viscerimonas tarda]